MEKYKSELISEEDILIRSFRDLTTNLFWVQVEHIDTGLKASSNNENQIAAYNEALFYLEEDLIFSIL